MPEGSQQNQQVGQQEEDIWNQILTESTLKVNKSTNFIESRSVVALGDRNCGKSSLIASLQKEEATSVSSSKGVALTYSFADVFESDNEDPTGRIDFWQLEGETSHKDLLQFGLNEKTILDSLVVICLDMSQPWGLVDSLRKWLTILQSHLQTIYPLLEKDGKSKPQQALLDRIRVAFQTYTEPSNDEKAESHLLTQSGALGKKKKRAQQQVDLACDIMATLEKDFDYNDDMFEYIQQYLRRICLNYGATLIYTSARKDTNCNLLIDYIEHHFFGFDFKTRCQLVEKENIFVPAGWDSIPKITLDFENQKICKDPDEPYENVIKKPNMIKRREQAQIATVAAEDDQEFLQRHKQKIEAEMPEKKEENEKGDLLSTFKKLGGGIVPATGGSTSGDGITNEDEEEDLRPNKGLTSSLTAKKPEAKVSPQAAGAAAGAKEPDKVALSQFFTSLMQKKPSTTNLKDLGDIPKGKTTPRKL